MKLSGKPIQRPGGFTLIELLIAALLAGIVTTAGLGFYMSVNQQAMSQEEVRNLLQLNRACLDEMATTLRSGGFGLVGQPAYKITGDTLRVFKRNGAATDTIRYFLEEFTDGEYTAVPGVTPDMKICKLMKQLNSTPAQIFADFVTDLRFIVIKDGLVAIVVEVQSSRADETFADNHGFRTFINTEHVAIRYNS